MHVLCNCVRAGPSAFVCLLRKVSGSHAPSPQQGPPLVKSFKSCPCVLGDDVAYGHNATRLCISPLQMEACEAVAPPPVTGGLTPLPPPCPTRLVQPSKGKPTLPAMECTKVPTLQTQEELPSPRDSTYP